MRRVFQIVLVMIGIGLVFALGRMTAMHDRGYNTGLHDGEVQGIREGRAEQLSRSLPSGMREMAEAAFDEGYVAGENDVFRGYDGGWGLAEPYVISLERGKGPITYRISSRRPFEAGTAYFLCPHSRVVCTEPR